MIRYAEVNSIESSGDCGMYIASIAIRERPMELFHSHCITVIGKDLTECVIRTNIILSAFNTEK